MAHLGSWNNWTRSDLIPVDLEDDDFFVPTVKDPTDLKIIVAGGVPGPESAVMHGWSGGSRSVSLAYTP